MAPCEKLADSRKREKSPELRTSPSICTSSRKYRPLYARRISSGTLAPRTMGSMRLYSLDEIERLRFIKRLVDDADLHAGWRVLDLPHDWAIEGPFDPAISPHQGARSTASQATRSAGCSSARVRARRSWIAGRSVSLLRRVGIDAELTFTGGVSRNKGMVSALEEKLDMKINVSEDSQFIGALGAALFALERAKARHDGELAAKKEVAS